MGKKNYLRVYLEKCKYRMKKTKMIKFIEAKLKSESDSELESDIRLELKSDWIIVILFQTTDFERVEELVVIFLTLNKSKT